MKIVKKMATLKYSIEVYEDHAIIRGWMKTDIFSLLLRFSRKEGFTHITALDDGSEGFKLVKK